MAAAYPAFSGPRPAAGDALEQFGVWIAEYCPGVSVEDAIAAVPELARLRSEAASGTEDAR